jgi:hypothetical protein
MTMNELDAMRSLHAAAAVIAEEVADIASLLCGHEYEDDALEEGMTIARKLHQAGLLAVAQ